jgi:hypothetical protein
VGFAIGADVRIGTLTVSYRYVPQPAAYNLPHTHRLAFGVSVF